MSIMPSNILRMLAGPNAGMSTRSNGNQPILQNDIFDTHEQYPSWVLQRVPKKFKVRYVPLQVGRTYRKKAITYKFPYLTQRALNLLLETTFIGELVSESI
jgi:hypothetical protein